VSREDFVAISARLFSIYLLFYLISRAPTAIHAVSQSDDFGLMAMSVLVFALLLILTALLWVFPLTVARKLLPVMREPRSEPALDSSVALSIGITLIGLWFLANAIIDSAYWLTLIIRASRTDEIPFEWSHEQIANMVATGVELLVSLLFILGSSGIKHLIYRFRYGAADAR